MMQTDFIVSLADIRFVEIHCKCKTKVTMDMQELPESRKKEGNFAPLICPGCSEQYDSAVAPAVNQFQMAYKSLVNASPESVTFRGVSSRDVSDRV